MSDKKNTREAGMRYYVGDPCYVIDNERWDTFCELLWERERKAGSRYGGVHISWATRGGEEDVVFVVSSPGGDGEWNFNMTDDMGQKVSLGVDAGLLAVVPIELCEDETGHDCGAWFRHEPSLKIEDERYVILNDHYDTLSNACDECGGRISDFDTFDTCRGYQVCEGCFDGCLDCDECGFCTCDKGGCSCEACEGCGKKERPYYLDGGRCDDCAEDEEE